MKCEKLAGLQPEGVFACFEKLCSIPHGSGNIEAISNYLKEFAESHGVRVIQDPVGDILWFQPATPGYEDHAPVLLQGHMDMVCEKDPDCTMDMAKEPLDLTHDDQFVFARGTTLGGDDGIAVAYAMALLEDPTIPHPPIEVLITVDEETGMTGAENIDMSQFSAMRLINLDSEDRGHFHRVLRRRRFHADQAARQAEGGLRPLHPSDGGGPEGRPFRRGDQREPGQRQQNAGRIHGPGPEAHAPVPDQHLRRQ